MPATHRMRSLDMFNRLSVLIVLHFVSCAFGPTPERVGFNYPEAGIRFSPRRGIASRAFAVDASSIDPESYKLLFPRMRSNILETRERLLFTGIEGEWNESRWPLYDEIGVNYFDADPQFQFELTEERDIDIPWPGVVLKTGKLRIFHMVPVEGSGETEQYSFTVTVQNYGNTYEVMWRDGRATPPDEDRYELFYHWTRGLRFFEPVVEIPEDSE